MAKQFSLNTQLTSPGGVFSKSIGVTCGASAEVAEEAVAAGTDTLVNIAFPYANVKAYYLYSSTDATLETNSSSSPSQTITLAAGVPKVWIEGGDGTNVFTANVTKFYLTNVANTVFTAIVAYDPTP